MRTAQPQSARPPKPPKYVPVPPGQRAVFRPILPLPVRFVLWVFRVALRLGRRAALAAVWVLHPVTVGRWRWQAAPLWVAVAAVTVRSWPLWGVAAGIVYAAPVVHGLRARRAERRGRPVPRRWLSDREAPVVAVVLVGVGTYWIMMWAVPGLAAAAPWWVPAVLVLSAAPWWWKARRVLPRPAASTVITTWAEQVAGSPRAGALTGTALIEEAPGSLVDTPEGPKGDALIALPEGTLPTHVERLDELAEHLLNAHAGTVNITRGVDVPQRFARITFAPRGDARVNRYFTEPTLDPKTGKFVGGYGGDRPVDASHWREGGAMNRAIVAGPGGGKQGMERLSMVEAALSPLVLPIVIDGKQGSGIPAVQAGAAFYARTYDEWSATLLAMLKILHLRENRYGLAGWDSFVPDTNGDPLIKILTDEYRWVKAKFPGLVSVYVEITGKGRGLGIGVECALQRGDAGSWGDTELRGNVYANGDRWLGASGDLAGAGVALQGEDFDLGTLPGEPGWAGWISKVNNGQATGTKARTLWIPSDDDVHRKGMEAPFGTVEQWMRDAVVPTLHPDEQAVLDSLRGGDPALVEDAKDAESDGLKAQGSRVDAAILELLRDLPEEAPAINRARIASAVGASATYVSERLKALQKDGLVYQEAPGSPWSAVR